MAARRRDARRRNWPPNLYESRGYYSWRDPRDGKTYGLGRDKRRAFEEAVEANIHIAGLVSTSRLVDRLNGEGDQTWGAWLDRYEAILAKRELSANTRRLYKSLLGRARNTLDAEDAVSRVTTKRVAEALDALRLEGKQRMAQAFRSFLADCFREALAAGWVERNPVEITKAAPVAVKRSRLSFEVFLQAYEHAEDAWLRNAMALALITAQRREDIVLAAFSDVRDGGWWCQQEKTGNKVFLPLELRLDCFGMSLDDVVKQCRSTGVLSRNLIHQTRPRGNSPAGSPIWKDTLSRRFTARLAELQLDWGEQTPPTFHEIRSLSERLYAAEGRVDTQALLGHSDPRTTALYHDARGSDWVRVKVG